MTMNKYYYATYKITADDLKKAADSLTIGQSVGNPSVRSEFETPELWRDHACVYEILDKESGIVKVGFPVANIDFNTDGLAHILVQTMGGQMDIDIIKGCRLLDLEFPSEWKWPGPKFGLSGMKAYCGVPDNQPLFGGITKPKVGLSPEKHLDLVKMLVDGGCNFIKEDEILSGAKHCPIKERVELVMNYIAKTSTKVFYCVSIHSNPTELLNRVVLINGLGGNGIHVNFHCGLGIYSDIRRYNFPLLMHFQKSGDKIFTSEHHRYSIDEKLLYKLMSLSGCDTLHCGMIGGYMDSDEQKTKDIVNMLVAQNSVPALSCGMKPSIVKTILDKLGHANWMANVGGALTGHNGGTLAGVKAMKQAVTFNYGKEYHESVEQWG
jgi:ribulose-bisphosphate carboxylase large chain